jgi:hypothetical protein
MTNGDDSTPDEDQDPLRPPLIPGDGRYDRFRRAADVPPDAMEAMRKAVREGLENAGVEPGAIPSELAEALEAQRQQLAASREMNGISMGMQAAGLHECFLALTAPERFTEAQALYYMAKATPGL